LALNDDERYVLIRTLPDGTPNGVRPVSNLNQGEQVLRALKEAGEAEWHLLDVLENKRIVVSSRWPFPPKCPLLSGGEAAPPAGSVPHP
jgi:hypothetical protein